MGKMPDRAVDHRWDNSPVIPCLFCLGIPEFQGHEAIGKLCGFSINRFGHKNNTVFVSIRMFTPDF